MPRFVKLRFLCPDWQSFPGSFFKKIATFVKVIFCYNSNPIFLVKQEPGKSNWYYISNFVEKEALMAVFVVY